MSVLLLLVGGILFACMVVFWKVRFQRNTGEMSSNSTSLALVRPSSSSTGSTKSNTNKRPTVNSLSQDILVNLPPSIAIQTRILINLSIVEYKLAELEHFLVTKRRRYIS